MKLLLVLPDLSGGGAERGQLQLVAGLADAGHDVTLFLIKSGGDLSSLIPENIKIHICLHSPERVRSRVVKIISEICMFARQNDLIIAGLELGPTYLACLAGRLTRRPVIGCIQIHLHSLLQKMAWWHGPMAGFIYRRLQHIVLISAGCLDKVRFIEQLDPDKISVIPNPFDLDKIKSLANERTPVACESFSDSDMVLAVGRLTDQKNFELLIRAHAKLREQGSRHILTIVGEGPLRQSLQALSHELKVADSVKMPGFFVNPYPFFRLAKCFVLSSHFEGMAMVLIEAQIIGVPIVAADCPVGVREVLADGKSGLLVESGNVNDLTEGIRCLLESVDLRQRFIERSQASLERYKIDSVVGKWERLLSKWHD